MSESRLLHVEVMPVMAPDGCPITADLAREYLLPTINGAERVAFVCHTALREDELIAMQEKAAADNAERLTTR